MSSPYTIEIDVRVLGPFYMVWRDGGSPPRKPHFSHSSARAEAERLARENVGARFYVMEAMEFYEVENPVTRVDLREVKQRRLAEVKEPGTPEAPEEP